MEGFWVEIRRTHSFPDLCVLRGEERLSRVTRIEE